jgi:hypothetical protein
MEQGTGPMVARLRLGALLRRRREAAQCSGRDAARAIGGSWSKISRMESGQVPSDPGDAGQLLTLYGVTDKAERDLALALARESGGPGWWNAWSYIPPSDRYVLEIEAAATDARSIDPLAVPALLQTPEYAAAVSSLSPFRGGLSETMLRHRQDPVLEFGRRVWAVLDEGVLRRAPRGNTAILADQLAYLTAKASTSKAVTVQIVPDGCPDMLLTPGPFTIIRLPGALADVVILEQLTSLELVDSPAVVERYKQIHSHVAVHALSVPKSLRLLRSAERDLRDGAQPAHDGRRGQGLRPTATN